jgi:transposase
MERYVNYLSVVQTLPWNKLKFADESHIVSNKLTNGRVLGMVNRRTWTPQHTLHAAHATFTILTNIVNIHSPIRCDYSPEVGNQWTFVDFVLDCCLANALVQGDYLIVDNAAIHCAADSRELLEIILEYFGVSLIFLPAYSYSPELNPCELVFSVVKQHIRKFRDPNSDICFETLKALATVSNQQLIPFYSHCIFPSVILPELIGTF